jgi:hypothetical protein
MTVLIVHHKNKCSDYNAARGIGDLPVIGLLPVGTAKIQYELPEYILLRCLELWLQL